MRDSRRDVIVQLLERYAELVDPVRAGNGDGRNGMLLMPPTYTASVKELERLLVRMRDDRSHPLLRAVRKDGTAVKMSLRSCWWHLNARYLRAERRTCFRCPKCSQLTHWPEHRHEDRRGRVGTYKGTRVLRFFPAGAVDELKVETGVAWLADNWGLTQEPMLPRELMVA